MSSRKCKEICEDCGKVFLAGPDSFLCPECRKNRISKAQKERQRSHKDKRPNEEVSGDKK